MSLEEFGRYVAAGMARKELGQGKLAVHIGVLPDGRTLDATQIRHILQGTRRSLDSALVQRIAEVLELDPLEAHRLAGTWPAQLGPEDIRDLSERRAARHEAATRAASRREGASAATSFQPGSGRTRDCPVFPAEAAA